jgi:7,8-dihydropterin-6-yl-methyl-4-(beta-D-ribofuranosyl)aminobenzene 5'-phosphate synthase
LSLAIKSPKGLILIDGCSHAGIEKIPDAAREVDPRVHLLLGGLHLVKTPDPEIERIVTELRDNRKLERIAPGHCAREPAFDALKRSFGERYIYAGLGSIVDLP